ncbi:MAG: hypothetical protein ABR562_10030 [Thermoplasmatota archaeon]
MLPTYRDGIEAGLEPVDWNPVRLVLRTLEQVDKSVMAHDVREELKELKRELEESRRRLWLLVPPVVAALLSAVLTAVVNYLLSRH